MKVVILDRKARVHPSIGGSLKTAKSQDTLNFNSNIFLFLILSVIPGYQIITIRNKAIMNSWKKRETAWIEKIWIKSRTESIKDSVLISRSAVNMLNDQGVTCSKASRRIRTPVNGRKRKIKLKFLQHFFTKRDFDCFINVFNESQWPYAILRNQIRQSPQRWDLWLIFQGNLIMFRSLKLSVRKDLGWAVGLLSSLVLAIVDSAYFHFFGRDIVFSSPPFEEEL